MDIDQPARAPFQTTVTVNAFAYTPVAIPAGDRLVVDNVSVSGFAASPLGPFQPIIILTASTSCNPSSDYYFAPQQNN